MELTQDRLKELLNYDPENGIFTWKVSPSNRIKVGAVAGSKDHYGYIVIRVLGRLYMSHRLAWLYVYGSWPNQEVDHINGKRADNRIENLRDVSRVVNGQNRHGPQGNNETSRLLGVTLHKASGKWHARIMLDNKNRHLGLFATPEAAHAAYLEAKRQHHEGCTI